MPSTVVHLALVGVLGETFSRRSPLVVFAVVVFVGLGVFVGLVVGGVRLPEERWGNQRSDGTANVKLRNYTKRNI